ncbi:MAG: indole-3-glycerol phosphate synthase TrpC [Candidatus Margulisbacteria bacterium]|nr:indole-3-glycerol phosphate synthase TrpC [Candidatus Margulisiibacteriota bacterium]
MQTVTKRARELRRNQTEAEKSLWLEIKAKKLGIKFVRQKPLIFDYMEQKRVFIADFYCKDLNFIIELDGEIHKKQKDYDELRTAIINQLGIAVLRFNNDDVMNDTHKVIQNIKSFLRMRREDLGERRNILSQIITSKKKRLKASPPSTSADSRYQPLPFLTKGKFQIIAEIKKGSPSLGLFKSDLDVAAIAKEYLHGGAAAISVLTEEDYFFGSPQDLMLARRTVNLPILRKDFIFTTEQIEESRAMGADAILLIVAVIKKAMVLKKLLKIARDLGLGVLVEVHDQKEINIALAAGARIIGINNRDLKTFKTDINLSLQLIKYLPADIISVSESGIHTSEEIKRLQAAGFDAVLIGEAFLEDTKLLSKIRFK